MDRNIWIQIQSLFRLRIITILGLCGRLYASPGDTRYYKKIILVLIFMAKYIMPLLIGVLDNGRKNFIL